MGKAERESRSRLTASLLHKQKRGFLFGPSFERLLTLLFRVNGTWNVRPSERARSDKVDEFVGGEVDRSGEVRSGSRKGVRLQQDPPMMELLLTVGEKAGANRDLPTHPVNKPPDRVW